MFVATRQAGKVRTAIVPELLRTEGERPGARSLMYRLWHKLPMTSVSSPTPAPSTNTVRSDTHAGSARRK